MKCQNAECTNMPATGAGRTGKFCSISCATKVNNRNRKKQVFCLRCQKQVAERHMKYCSSACYHLFKVESSISKWLAGEVSGSHSSGELKKLYRDFLIEEANQSCSSPTCAVPGGWSVPNPVIGKVILTIDHIDGDWKNNKRENLIVLCYNCHTLTSTFGSLNKGKGKSNRSIGSRRH